MIGDRDKDALEDILYCIDLLKEYSEGLEEKEFLSGPGQTGFNSSSAGNNWRSYQTVK